MAQPDAPPSGTPPSAALVTMRDPANRPSPRAVALWAINASLMWVPVFIAQLVWAIVDVDRGPHLLVLAVTVVLAAAHVAVVPRWRYRVHRWDISDTAVYTLTGWFNQERRIAPIARIQTVDSERGPIDRMLGLSTVTITTASSAGAVKIAALDVATADNVVARLTAIASSINGDAT